jgi:hypothetical protein
LAFSARRGEGVALLCSVEEEKKRRREEEKKSTTTKNDSDTPASVAPEAEVQRLLELQYLLMDREECGATEEVGGEYK